MSETAVKTEQTDGLYTPGIVVAGVVSAVATFAIIVGLQALYLSLERSQQREAAQNAINTSESIIAEQQSKLNQYGWIDREQDVVSIPIDRAIELTAAELSVFAQWKGEAPAESTSSIRLEEIEIVPARQEPLPPEEGATP